MYDRGMMRELLAPIVQLLIDHVLVEREEMPTRRFLPSVRDLNHMRDIFAAEFELAWTRSAWRRYRN